MSVLALSVLLLVSPVFLQRIFVKTNYETAADYTKKPGYRAFGVKSKLDSKRPDSDCLIANYTDVVVR